MDFYLCKQSGKYQLVGGNRKQTDRVWNNGRALPPDWSPCFVLTCFKIFQLQHHFASKPASKAKTFQRRLGHPLPYALPQGQRTIRPCAHLLKLVLPFID